MTLRDHKPRPADESFLDALLALVALVVAVVEIALTVRMIS